MNYISKVVSNRVIVSFVMVAAFFVGLFSLSVGPIEAQSVCPANDMTCTVDGWYKDIAGDTWDCLQDIDSCLDVPGYTGPISGKWLSNGCIEYDLPGRSWLRLTDGLVTVDLREAFLGDYNDYVEVWVHDGYQWNEFGTFDLPVNFDGMIQVVHTNKHVYETDPYTGTVNLVLRMVPVVIDCLSLHASLVSD